VTEIFAQRFDPVVRRFIAMLRKALPDADAADLFWSYHMLCGSLAIVSLDTGTIEHLSSGLCRSGNFDQIEPRLVKYSAEGFRAVCGHRLVRKTRK